MALVRGPPRVRGSDNAQNASADSHVNNQSVYGPSHSPCRRSESTHSQRRPASYSLVLILYVNSNVVSPAVTDSGRSASIGFDPKKPFLPPLSGRSPTPIPPPLCFHGICLEEDQVLCTCVLFSTVNVPKQATTGPFASITVLGTQETVGRHIEGINHRSEDKAFCLLSGRRGYEKRHGKKQGYGSEHGSCLLVEFGQGHYRSGPLGR